MVTWWSWQAGGIWKLNMLSEMCRVVVMPVLRRNDPAMAKMQTGKRRCGAYDGNIEWNDARRVRCQARRPKRP